MMRERIVSMVAGISFFLCTAATGQTLVGSFAASGVNDIVVSGTKVFTTYFDSALAIHDVSTPSSPSGFGAFDTTGTDAADGVAVAGEYAYVAALGGLAVFTVGATPLLYGFVDLPEDPIDVAVSGDYAYVSSSSHGFHIVDISAPSNPTVAGSYYVNADSSSYEPANDIAVQGDLAYIAFEDSGLHIVNVANRQAPVFAGRYIEEEFMRIWGVAVAGDYAYLSAYDQGLKIIDVSDPTSPTLAGGYDVPDNMDSDSWDVEVVGNTAFILYQAWGARIVDVSDPSAPVYTGRYPTSAYVMGGDFRQMTVSGDYMYLYHDDDNEVIIVDVSTFLPVKNTPRGRKPAHVRMEFGPSSTLRVHAIPAALGKEVARLSVHDTKGRVVSHLYHGPASGATGEYRLAVPSGAYTISLATKTQNLVTTEFTVAR